MTDLSARSARGLAVGTQARPLQNKQVLVVGATGAIGQAVSREASREGARVMGTGRNQAELRELRAAGIQALPLDLRPASYAASELRSEVERLFSNQLDGLVFTAGAHGPIGPTRSLDPTALLDYLDEHLVSTVAIVQSLAPALDRSPSPSIVILSGGGATAARPNFTPYALSKVAAVRLAENLAAEEPDWRVNAVAPGLVASRIHDSTLAAGFDRSGEDPDDLRKRLGEAHSPQLAAELIGFLLSDAASGISGRLLSAPWDPWRDPEWRRRLAGDERLGRLRRIDSE